MYKLDFSHPCSLYFVGIGGISMCCLAELLADAGFRVQGSDRSKSHLTDVLESKGITVHIGQRAQNIPQDVDCAVFTGAIHPDNPEYIAVQERNIAALTDILTAERDRTVVIGTHGTALSTMLDFEGTRYLSRTERVHVEKIFKQ